MNYLNNLKNEIMPESASFLSQLPRLAKDNQLHQSPPVGLYNPDTSVLGKELISKRGGIHDMKSEISMHDNSARKNPPPFLSEVKRFSDQVHTGA
jgi:hypothetical protein